MTHAILHFAAEVLGEISKLIGAGAYLQLRDILFDLVRRNLERRDEETPLIDKMNMNGQQPSGRDVFFVFDFDVFLLNIY